MGGGGGRGIGGGVRENNANRFLLRMANLLIFIHNGGIRKVITPSRLKKMVPIFLLRKSSKRVQCSNEFVSLSHEILCHAMVDNKVMWWPECIQPPTPSPQKKIVPK